MLFQKDKIIAIGSKKKCLLINPPTGLYDRWDRCQSPIEDETIELVRPPMDLAYIGSIFESFNIKCKIKDYPAERENWKNFEKDLENFKPDILFASTVIPTFDKDYLAFEKAKQHNNEILTIAKGAPLSDFYKKKLDESKHLDIYIWDDQILTTKELLEKKNVKEIKGLSYKANGKFIKNQSRSKIKNLDAFPFPSRHLLNDDLYRMPDTGNKMTIILTSVGCPHKCTFCLVSETFGKTVNSRSVESIVNEVEECVNVYGIRDIWFRADLFTFSKKWVIDLCKKIVEKKITINWTTNSRVDTIDEEMVQWMKKSGCSAIGFGIESGNQEILNQIKKEITLEQTKNAVTICKKNGILTYIFLIIGLPWETESTIKETIKLAKQLKADFTNFTISYPYPGTEMYEFAVKNNLLKREHSLASFDYSKPAIDTLYLPKEEIIQWKKKATRAVLLHPSFILRTLLRMRSFAELKNYLQAGFKLIFKIF